jgi:hypothetical protein
VLVISRWPRRSVTELDSNDLPRSFLESLELRPIPRPLSELRIFFGIEFARHARDNTIPIHLTGLSRAEG